MFHIIVSHYCFANKDDVLGDKEVKRLTYALGEKGVRFDKFYNAMLKYIELTKKYKFDKTLVSKIVKMRGLKDKKKLDKLSKEIRKRLNKIGMNKEEIDNFEKLYYEWMEIQNGM